MHPELQTWRDQNWRSAAGSRLWLSALIAAMEEASGPAPRRVEPATVEQFRAQLALPASFRQFPGSASTLRH
jgi:hypothetical protein